jgi:hypothetical protein
LAESTTVSDNPDNEDWSALICCAVKVVTTPRKVSRMITKMGGKAFFVAAIVVFSSDQAVLAQFPNWKAIPVRPRGELIPPLGNHLPLSYRAQMNRPTYLGGRIAYTIEPSSQEAMAWQRAWEKGYYANHTPRMETHYIYPQAWEVLGVEPKPKRDPNTNRDAFEPVRQAIDPSSQNQQTDIQPESVDAPLGMPESTESPLKAPGDSSHGQFENSTQELRMRLGNETREASSSTGSLQLAPSIDLMPFLTPP